MHTILKAVVKLKPVQEKKKQYSGLNGIRTHDLCDIVTGLYIHINWAIKPLEAGHFVSAGILRTHNVTSSQMAW